jgi:hypothetical protein
MEDMTNSQPTTDLSAVYRTSVFLTLSMMASLVAYAAVVELINFRGRAVVPIERLDVIRVAVAAVGISLFVVARVVRKAMLRKSPADAVEVLLPRLARATMVTSAISETPAVMGVLLFFIGGKRVDFYLMALVSLAMFTAYFPRMSVWKDWLGPVRYEPRA